MLKVVMAFLLLVKFGIVAVLADAVLEGIPHGHVVVLKRGDDFADLIHFFSNFLSGLLLSTDGYSTSSKSLTRRRTWAARFLTDDGLWAMQ